MPFRYLLAMLNANEVKITMTLVKRSFNKMTFGPSLSGEVVTTIDKPITAKATDAQMNTFVAIFCIDLVYHLKQPPQVIYLTLKPNFFKHTITKTCAILNREPTHELTI